MMTIALLFGLHSPWLTFPTAWFRPPILRVVPAHELWLQTENGIPVKTRRRSRLELLEAALAR